ncbi:IMP cyclohydrolase /phosphoribosylaminoimidazolecarboxamide formyltransferase /formyltetrahydrofolate-dependent phosphoribosylglycinamide formyltransferase [Halovenus aranensis]|uniref:IMP cyclohydrolase /phosphoribosylaminoimidazolecarboxamide formyltransferase /formyltetrahydrofolate-dependent phosphoribosylglycinamide formyltransferase n=1 Tax=Halovenus aranensis TaxID=890420 RepID=A0A1G8W7S7_9EURY|nr:bifunctional phosphoribosylaminoimidazolecarboxamide formyltransferase/IMP cyclohydrolase [Halovenus aranensis]SDJ73775.1 IMP cyclohydrolase /phosphoribosylaminoimidazolecarboxamide formyltransferase /formyltetrahydrofolate-dependent phosphoribosylglycinamide formyltransferase [Halovenus aranensis]
MKLAGMASNRGRNLMNIADREPGGATFEVIVTNDDSAPVLEAAKKRGIDTAVVERADGESRRSHERRIVETLTECDIDLICLDGYMRILSDTFLDEMPTTLNVHPSILPSFPGTDAWGDALETGVSVTGCTVHVVTDATDEDGNVVEEQVDGGPVVTQEPVPVYEGDTAAELKERVLYQGEFTAYPRAVKWFAEGDATVGDGSVRVDADDGGQFPARRLSTGDRQTTLRYGENPHQDGALYAEYGVEEASVVDAPQLNEGAKALSYNNYNDADGALNLIKEFDEPAAAVIKHTNPAGCATAETLADAYEQALATDPMSAFGGIVALNRECDAATAEQIVDSYKEVVVAPGYTDDALDVLCEKGNLRVLDVGELGERTDRFTEKSLVGGRLVQERDRQTVTAEDLDVVTEREPTDEQIRSMLFAWQTIKHVKSNAILFADGTETVGIGMGQVSRVDAVRLAAMKADEHAEGKDAQGAVMASDAFFPFPDGIEHAAEAGIDAVIQPGGSKNDDAVIEAANEHGMAMVFTGNRCFRHD